MSGSRSHTSETILKPFHRQEKVVRIVVMVVQNQDERGLRERRRALFSHSFVACEDAETEEGFEGEVGFEEGEDTPPRSVRRGTSAQGLA